MPDICSWGTNYTFCNYYHLRFLITIWVPKWGQFLRGWGLTVDPDPTPDLYLCCTFWPEFRVHSKLWLQSDLCPTWAHSLWGVNSGSRSNSISIFGLYFWPEFRVHTSSGSSAFYVTPVLIVWGWTLDPDPYLSCTFWPEFRVHSSWGAALVPSVFHLSSLWWRVHSGSSSSPISVSPQFIVGGLL